MKKNNSINSWVYVADLMSILMMVFMFLGILFLYKLKATKISFQKELNIALNNEFGKDLDDWSAIITNDNIIRFKAPFKIGDINLTEKYKNILKDFFPRYIKLLTSDNLKQKINEIRIEGHTSYGWAFVDDINQIYLKNMKLSQERSYNVLNFVYTLDNQIINKNHEWLIQRLRSNGLSYSKPVYKDIDGTIIDEINSKRVEFIVISK